MFQKCLLLLHCFASVDGFASNMAQKILLDASKYPEARCLDGSMGAFYWSPGSSKTKFYLHQQGGGGCNSYSDCSKRSHSGLGSTEDKYWKQTYDLSTYEVFSRSKKENPLLHDWNQVRVHTRTNQNNSEHVTWFCGRSSWYTAMEATLLAVTAARLPTMTQVVEACTFEALPFLMLCWRR